MVNDLDEAYASCERIARAHYENFPVASLLLPRPLRRHVAAVYAFARAADDFADEGELGLDERYDLLDGWLARLRSAEGSRQPGPGPRAGEPDGTPQIFHALGATIREKRLPLRLFEDLLSAFRQDVGVGRYATWDDVLDYSSRSANPVGRLVLRIAGYEDARLDSWSDAICTALQLTNFWQDVKPDFERGRVYLPRQQAEAYAADEADLARSPRIQAVAARAGGGGRADARAVRRRRVRCAMRCTAGCVSSFGRPGWAGCVSSTASSGPTSTSWRGGRLSVRVDFGWLTWRVATWVPR